MKINRLVITIIVLIGLVLVFTSPPGFVCGMFLFFVLGAGVYLGLPILVLRLLAVRFWNHKVLRLIVPLVSGLLMSQHWALGASLAVRYLGFGENLLSYHYASSPYLSIAPMAGAASGFLILMGARLHLTVEKFLFASGCFVLLMMSFYTGFLIIAPE